jgi:succinate dehydrogenase flavin-adding protein (antitoxin of CptAB toxin-antitoxin module)
MTSLNDKYFITMDKEDEELLNYINNKNKKVNIIDNIIIVFTSNIIKSEKELYEYIINTKIYKKDEEFQKLVEDIFENFDEYYNIDL